MPERWRAGAGETLHEGQQDADEDKAEQHVKQQLLVRPLRPVGRHAEFGGGGAVEQVVEVGRNLARRGRRRCAAPRSPPSRVPRCSKVLDPQPDTDWLPDFGVRSTGLSACRRDDLQPLGGSVDLGDERCEPALDVTERMAIRRRRRVVVRLMRLVHAATDQIDHQSRQFGSRPCPLGGNIQQQQQ